MRIAAIAIILAFVALPGAILVAQEEPVVRTARTVTDMPVEPNTALARAELYRLIGELQSISFRDPANPVSKQSDTNASTWRASGHRGAVTDANSMPEKAAVRSEPAVLLKPAVLPIVSDPNTISNLFEMAEALYKMGRYRESAACYQVVLSRASSEKKSGRSEAERAWVLFQIGNCHARTEPGEAVKVYRQLMTEHPSSEWTPIAISRERLIQWYISSDITPTLERR